MKRKQHSNELAKAQKVGAVLWGHFFSVVGTSRHHFTASKKCLCWSAGFSLCFISLCLPLQAQNPEVLELRAALKMTQQKLAQSEAQRLAVSQSFAESVRVAEEQTLTAREVQGKMEALGVDLFNSSKDSLEQRLLKSVRDLHIMRQESERQRKALHQLSEAFLKYIAATPDAKENVKGEAHEAIAKAGHSLKALVDTDQIPVKKLERSQVVSFDPKNGIVVLDAGRKSGVRVGTPITVERDEKPIYTALIVDVRDSISGALLQNRVGNAGDVKVGDKIRPLATEGNF